MLSVAHKTTLRSTVWFNAMSETVQNAIIESIKVLTLSPGKELYAKGDVGNGFHCVLEGRVKVSNIHTSGKQMVLAYLDVGSWFGEISMFDGLGRTHDAHADKQTLLAFISRSDFHRLLQRYPETYHYFTQLLCQRLRNTFSFIDASASLNLKQQLAKRLVLLSSNFGQRLAGHNTYDISASQETLAMMINSSRQTVNRLLKEMEQQGLIRIRYGGIALLDLAQIKTLCEWE
ncbi:Crp/Fnr family transcriptional regulator [Alteromonas flava]|uniref:Crp/Fnr family transcriptional regulator n=1 Tax=Alteromonas flava TaxID=2048003 RepID=UPI000C28653D|nr:Crp/Fnr family transcriptional regulator [Alteromonas flava]